MIGNRLISVANDFFENYARSSRHSEYEDRHRIEQKLARFERETWNEAIEKAAAEIETIDIANGVRPAVDAVLSLRRDP